MAKPKSKLPTRAPKQTGSNQRRALRLVTGRAAEIQLCGTHPTTVRVNLCDISGVGVGLICPRSIERGQQFLLWLRDGGSVAISGPSLLYTVVHCRRCGDRMFRIGAEFTCLAGDQVKGSGTNPEELERLRQIILS